MEEGASRKEDTRCFRCGAPTDIQMGDIWICETCYQVRSACCSEFEDDDGEEG